LNTTNESHQKFEKNVKYMLAKIYDKIEGSNSVKKSYLSLLKTNMLNNFPELRKDVYFMACDEIEVLWQLHFLKMKSIKIEKEKLVKYIKYLRTLLTENHIHFRSLKKAVNENLTEIYQSIYKEVYNKICKIIPSRYLYWKILCSVIDLELPYFYKICAKCGNNYAGHWCDKCEWNYLFCPDCNRHLILNKCFNCGKNSNGNNIICSDCGVHLEYNICPDCNKKWFDIKPKFFLKVKDGVGLEDTIVVKLTGILAQKIFDMSASDIWLNRKNKNIFLEKIKDKKISFYGICIYDKKRKKEVLIAEPPIQVINNK